MQLRNGFRIWITLLASLMLVATVGCGGPKKKLNNEPILDYKEALNQHNMGKNYLTEMKYQEALPYLKRAVELEPENCYYNHWLGFAYMNMGDMNNAEKHLLKAIQINPEHTDSYNNLATIYIETGRYKEAVENLKKVLADTAFNAPELAYYNLGLCYLAMGKQELAIAAFEQAIVINKEFYRAHLAIGKMLLEDEQYEKAIRHLQTAEKGYPNDVEVLYEIGKAFFKAKNFREAQRYLSQVSILFPDPEIDRPTQMMLEIIGKSYQ
ncbi:MAG: tetratricopeptide repeat protein [Acidobacteria bacterium]|nr:tetratricopeptide repeat protein [Acidobacteriota bacterium]